MPSFFTTPAIDDGSSQGDTTNYNTQVSNGNTSSSYPIIDGSGTYLTTSRDALRLNASANLSFKVNHRYKGHRESNKFNLSIQSLGVSLSSLIQQIELKNTQLDSVYSSFYPSESDIAKIYYVGEMQRFLDWMYLKPSSNLWYV